MERYNTTHYHEYFPAALIIYRDEDTRKVNIDVLFSGNSLHSLAATVNLISNFELQYLPNGIHRIKTTNAPMHRYGFTFFLCKFHLYSKDLEKNDDENYFSTLRFFFLKNDFEFGNKKIIMKNPN